MDTEVASAETIGRPAREGVSAPVRRRAWPIVSRLRSWPRRRAALLALAGILALGLALRLWLLSRDVPTLDSDEAVIGLMALHLRHGEWSVFFWGQSYMGSLEAVLAAPFLWLFGPSTLTLRLAPLLIGLAAIACIYALGARLFSPRVGIASAALLALGPPFFVVLSVRAYGGYVETLLFGPLLLLLALRGSAPAERTRGANALTGLIAGLALWTNPLVAPFLAGVGLIWWLQRRADLLRARKWLPLAGGLLLGVLPAVVENVRDGGATVTTLLGLTALGAHGAQQPSASLAQNLWLALTVSLPILAGVSAFAGTQAAGLTPDVFAQARAQHPLVYAGSVALVALVAGVALWGAAGLVRRRGELRSAPAGGAPAGGAPAGDGAQVARQGQAALALAGALYLAAFALTKQVELFATPRYLFPLYAATPLLVGWSAGLARCARAALREPTVWRRAMWAASVAAVALVAAWDVAGTAMVTPRQTAALDHGTWISGRDYELLRVLRAHGVRTVISNDYWEGLRLTFESGETIVTVMVTPTGHPGFNRYRPYVTEGLADPRPAYVELLGTPEAALHAAWLRDGRLPGYTALVADGYAAVVPGG